MTVSIKDIAKAAGVSHPTVSRALANSPLVSPETAQRIRRLAEEMGYAPSAIARGLVTKRTHTIGLVVTTIADPFIAEVVSGVEEVALNRGYSVFLANSNAVPEREMTVVRTLRERRVDGIIVLASRVGGLYMPLLEQSRVPIVLINNQHQGPYVYSVSIDSVTGAVEATKHLIKLGHRRIAYIGDRYGVQSDVDRLAGYKRALGEAGIEFDSSLVFYGDGKASGVGEAARQLLSLNPLPSAVFCYNDMTALGLLQLIKQAGKRVPQDISVVGFDDIFLASYTDPPLTTIAQPKHEMGRRAMEMLLALISKEQSVTNITVQGRLVVRQSAAPLG